MAGIDNITREILQEAEAEAARLISAARADADARLAEVRAECERIAAAQIEQSESSAGDYRERIAAQAEMGMRREILKAKQEIIEEVISEAYRRLASLDDRAYFDMLEKMVAGNVQKGEGEVLLSKKDLDRRPAEFEAVIQRIAEQQGGSLTISEEPAAIADGLILRYNGIDENCTLSAMFAEKKEILQDRVHSVLW